MNTQPHQNNLDVLSLSPLGSCQGSRKRRQKSPAEFIVKTYQLLEDESLNQQVCWSEDGLSFIILDELGFAKEALPKYFRHFKYSSFVRQLNMYGFKKLKTKCRRDRFSHPYFARDQSESLKLIKKRSPDGIQEEGEEVSPKTIQSDLATESEDNLSVKITELKKLNEEMMNHHKQLELQKRKMFSNIGLIYSNLEIFRRSIDGLRSDLAKLEGHFGKNELLETTPRENWAMVNLCLNKRKREGPEEEGRDYIDSFFNETEFWEQQHELDQTLFD
eukprot:TRINITY_DN3085_c0_g3_i3.p1 TRINITY_DN3085_c0_g3~~TRINITY_DN3085_c0_g3_i3.p1  ORF type:complete len:275 (+),score=55.88 TRINITY_DN3085_c0_g3_i3:45-869(+)